MKKIADMFDDIIDDEILVFLMKQQALWIMKLKVKYKMQ